jgi:hypothetical protein
MDTPQREAHFPGNASPAADVPLPLNAAAFPAPQYLQVTPLSYPRPVAGQLHGHAGVVRDAMVSDWHRDVTPLTKTHMPTVLVPAGECRRQSSANPGLGGYAPTHRKQCRARSLSGPAAR